MAQVVFGSNMETEDVAEFEEPALENPADPSTSEEEEDVLTTGAATWCLSQLSSANATAQDPIIRSFSVLLESHRTSDQATASSSSSCADSHHESVVAVAEPGGSEEQRSTLPMNEGKCVTHETDMWTAELCDENSLSHVQRKREDEEDVPAFAGIEEILEQTANRKGNGRREKALGRQSNRARAETKASAGHSEKRLHLQSTVLRADPGEKSVEEYSASESVHPNLSRDSGSLCMPCAQQTPSRFCPTCGQPSGLEKPSSDGSGEWQSSRAGLPDCTDASYRPDWSNADLPVTRETRHGVGVCFSDRVLNLGRTGRLDRDGVAEAKTCSGIISLLRPPPVPVSEVFDRLNPTAARLWREYREARDTAEYSEASGGPIREGNANSSCFPQLRGAIRQQAHLRAQMACLVDETSDTDEDRVPAAAAEVFQILATDKQDALLELLLSWYYAGFYSGRTSLEIG
ncbi:hypothetical protein TGRUB_270610 [Toxoplasma gondii RUB]|uniref:Uncharacterized protein n=2 Tax=Toxoplasma gondii TaxID=5811 RepID=A0A086LY99_TOXGO|nr:hypothetical protein TGRUB_270610 [Toxoplasma gondii RUB]